MTNPTLTHYQPNLPYTPSSATDIRTTYEKFGFVPPSSIPGYFEHRRAAILGQMTYDEFPIEVRGC